MLSHSFNCALSQKYFADLLLPELPDCHFVAYCSNLFNNPLVASGLYIAHQLVE